MSEKNVKSFLQWVFSCAETSKHVLALHLVAVAVIMILLLTNASVAYKIAFSLSIVIVIAVFWIRNYHKYIKRD